MPGLLNVLKKKLEFLDNSPQSAHMYVVCNVIEKTSEKICIVFTKSTGTVLCSLSQPYLNISIKVVGY